MWGGLSHLGARARVAEIARGSFWCDEAGGLPARRNQREQAARVRMTCQQR